MKTLSKEITKDFYKNEDGYQELKTAWSAATQNKDIELTATDYLLYAILRGKDWTKALPIKTNSVKVENGGVYDGKRYVALLNLSAGLLRSENDLLFYPFLTDNALDLIKKLINKKAITNSGYEGYNDLGD